MSQEQLFCVNHPGTPTVLRCNKCGSPICVRCAVQTPVGYRCKNCVRNQQAVFYTAFWYDYVIAGVVALIIAGVAQAILLLGSYLGVLVVFAGLLVGAGIAEAVRLATGRRRGEHIWLVTAVCMVLASTPVLLLAVLGQDIYGALIDGVYLVLAVGAASARLRVGK